jgi:hypothetical protein
LQRIQAAWTRLRLRTELVAANGSQESYRQAPGENQHHANPKCAGHPVGVDSALRALGVRDNFGTTEGEKEWFSGFQATRDEAFGFFDLMAGIQAVNFGLKRGQRIEPSQASDVVGEVMNILLHCCTQ